MFGKILIANRGEIACRVIRTARRLGVATVAVHSDVDSGALHVQAADEAIGIGSYLDIGTIVAAARRSDAEAIHPGYGFLAENPDFADACAEAGIVFIGPPAAAIRAMGSKAAAKALMEKAGVPTVPGYHGEKQDEETLAAAAKKIGYPVLIKASAGGGGKGMRIVAAPSGFVAALEGAKREAKSAFADDRVLIEKYLAKPRHVEVQIFGDSGGNLVHLFERDCSVQRRHQKVIEEAPAPDLPAAMRRKMHEVAIAAARAVNYVNAGTVELIAEGGDFYFMEMNTRLQVEHPVTEMITGLDLVEWQLRIASGEKLPLPQKEIAAKGHAVEARIYAEDPARDFLPSTGRLDLLHWPEAGGDFRIETGVREGDIVTPYYDPMIAKLVAWGGNREAAIERLAAGLAAARIAGVATNRDFLLRVLRHPEFAGRAVDTGFIPRHRDTLSPPFQPAPDAVLAAVGYAVTRAETLPPSRDPYSPWRRRDGWRLDGRVRREFHWRDGDRVRVVAPGDAPGPFAVSRRGDVFTVIDGGNTWRLTLIDPLASRGDAAAAVGGLTAPMPGKIVQVLAAPGAAVKKGQPLLVLEAMKMEHTISAPADGTVDQVHFAAGDLVKEGTALIEFTPQ